MTDEIHLDVYLANYREYEPFRVVVREETDRAAAILGAAYLDSLLEQLLRDYFIQDAVVEELLGTDRPLCNFSARIDASFALGLVSTAVHRDLHFVRKIRNKFAHKIEVHTFEESPFRDLCAEFAILKRFPDYRQWNRPGDLYRRIFELALGFLMGEINERIKCTPHQAVGKPYGSGYQAVEEAT
jgi:hypothetical protein